MGIKTNQVIKALECCMGEGDCVACPCEKDCTDELHTAAIYLIKEQEKEIAGLKKHIARIGLLNSNLLADNKRLEEELEHFKTRIEVRAHLKNIDEMHTVDVDNLKRIHHALKFD